MDSTCKTGNREFLMVLLNTLTSKKLPVCARKSSSLVALDHWIANIAEIGWTKLCWIYTKQESRKIKHLSFMYEKKVVTRLYVNSFSPLLLHRHKVDASSICSKVTLFNPQLYSLSLSLSLPVFVHAGC